MTAAEYSTEVVRGLAVETAAPAAVGGLRRS